MQNDRGRLFLFFSCKKKQLSETFHFLQKNKKVKNIISTQIHVLCVEKITLTSISNNKFDHPRFKGVTSEKSKWHSIFSEYHFELLLTEIPKDKLNKKING